MNNNVDFEYLSNIRITHKMKELDIECIMNGLEREDYCFPDNTIKFSWSKEDICGLIFSLIKNIPIKPINMYYDDNTRTYVYLETSCQEKVFALFLYLNNLYYKDDCKIDIDFSDLLKKTKQINELKKEIKEGENTLTIKEVKLKKDFINGIYAEIEDKYNLVYSDFSINKDKHLDLNYHSLSEKAQRVIKRKEIMVVMIQCLAEDEQKVYLEMMKLMNK